MYINWYFTEVQGLGLGEYRSFEIYKDDDNFSLPIVPRIGYVSQLLVSDLSVNGTINFSIVTTDDSTLPPLVNAIEIFSISDALTNGTDDNNAEGLDSLKSAFDVLKDWEGDPYTRNPLLTSSSNEKKTCKLSVILAIAIPVFFIV
ncbi:Malectin-like carbohydrate-binding domain-containing protein [Cynara cardunculus var. scolymus]|uniref:Malectin-like carbohydrate-binding domain-containing protein n=1 Tax=Cynara cardunculus var. scolymus TaxID=59895 RepID=A0A103Y2D1_CYNCS|nr:Malectin-like carbohydrate-binding domain-containing protein [Cynara cardunculus var. scolymus]